MVKQLFCLYKFYGFFCRRHSLMNRPCYNNLFQFMQHDNFQNLNRVIFTHWKHLDSRVKAFWYCFPVIKRYSFYYYFMKSAPISGNQTSFEILQLFDIWHYQSLVMLFFSSVVTLSWIRWCLSYIAGQFSLGGTWLKVDQIIDYHFSCLAKFTNNKLNTAFLHEIVIIFLQFIYHRPLMWLVHSVQRESYKN